MRNNITPTNYNTGRPIGEFKRPHRDVDRTFAGQRLEEEVEEADYRHCTFINLGFKEVEFKDSKFLNCIFVGCYFRRARMINCGFQGCQFIDCKFPRISIKSCDFRYSNFRGCQIAFSEIRHSLPPEPNLREELSRNLALESLRAGLYRDAKHFKTVSINAHEEHLKAAFTGNSEWYRNHFDAIERSKAFLYWLGSLVNGCVWGHGESLYKLLRTYMVSNIVFFPLLFLCAKNELSHNSDHEITIQDILHFSLQNAIPAGVVSDIKAVGLISQFIAGSVSLFSGLMLAFFAAYIFRSILRQ